VKQNRDKILLTLVFNKIGTYKIIYFEARALNAQSLCVLSECVVAFCAPHELSRRVIKASRLHFPDKSSVFSAFWALDSNGWERSEFLFFLAYHGYKLLWSMLDHLNACWLGFLSCLSLFVLTFAADKHQGFAHDWLQFLELEAITAFWAEFHALLLRYRFAISFAWFLLNFS
jgi:hypothetical protein